jgi:hypothetical protein
MDHRSSPGAVDVVLGEVFVAEEVALPVKQAVAA